MSTRPAGIAPATLVVFTVASGIAVANVYYLQPILELMARDFRVPARTMGMVATALQVGYALGIATFVPLGDIVQRRRLVVAMFATVTVALAFVVAAPNVALLALAFAVVGVFTTAAQVLIPFAADLAAPHERGHVLGIVQSGLIIGTLSARAIGGAIGAQFGWRAVYVFAAVVAGVTTLALARVMPLRAPRSMLRYRDLIASMPSLVARYVPLRVSIALGFLSFGTFTGIWTVLAFHVRTLGYGSDVVGYVGLVSLAGAAGAIAVGGLADRHGTLLSGTIGWIVTIVSLLAFLFAGGTLLGVGFAAMLFSVGTQVTQVSNQTRNLSLSDDARSRINTIYMVGNFTGGAVGSFVASIAWDAGGWSLVCTILLGALALMGIVLAWYATTRTIRVSSH